MAKIFPTYIKRTTTSGSGNVAWGPDFGEGSAGSDGTTFRVGVNLDLDSLALEHNKTVGVNLTMPTLALEHNKTVGVHLSGTAEGAPFWQNVSTAVGALDALSVTVATPAGTVNGDGLVAIVCTADALNAPVHTTLAGWTAETSTTRAAPVANMRVSVFHKVASGEPANLTFAWSLAARNSVVEVHRYIGAHATDIFDVGAGATLAAASLDPDPDSPSVTTTVVNDSVLFHLWHDHLTLPQTHTFVAAVAERTDFESDQGIAAARTVFGSHSGTRVFAAIGATGAVDHNCTEAVATDAVMTTIAVIRGTVILAT